MKISDLQPRATYTGPGPDRTIIEIIDDGDSNSPAWARLSVVYYNTKGVHRTQAKYFAGWAKERIQ